MYVLSSGGRHVRPLSRQARAARLAVSFTAVLILTVLVLAAGELHDHGFASFVFRQAGTGATRADAPPFPSPGPPQIPVPAGLSQPGAIVMLVVPPLQHRRSVIVTVVVRAGEWLVVLPRKPP